MAPTIVCTKMKKRICSMAVTSTSAVAVSSSSNGHEKKQGPVGPDGSKRGGAAGRSESTKHVPVINSDVLLMMKQSEQLLKRLMSHKFGWVFNTPVDVVKLKVPDYHTVIKHPMDLGTIKAKIASSAYSNPWGFAADVRLTFTNAMTYNPPGNDFHFMADVMSKFFEARWRPIEKKLAAADSGVKRKAEPPMMVPQPKKRKVPLVNHHIIMQERVKPNIKLEEKESLSRQLRSLIAELPEHIMNFISRHGNNVTCDNEIEIDINSLSDDTLFELRRLLDDYLREKQTRQHAKAVPCGMEIPNESGHLNSSEDPFTGNELADEDVDIGGNDPPISSYPPVEIEKDTAPRSSTISSSGDSSSSDSDSGRCSGSESGDGGACPAKTAKVSGGRETTADQKEGDTMDSHDTNRNVNGLDQREPDACHKPRSVEKDDCEQGGAALSGRPVSPDKLYRAALMRSRFADTILKAHEKTLGRSENQGDPEKLRREREELERRQRKERARLQAEAKAAEEACRQAKAAAAAEAKRKRELERELQKRICSMAVTSTSAVAVSSSSNGHEKKQGPVGPDGSKRGGAAGRSESTKHVPVINSDVLLMMKQSEQLLKRLMSHKFGWVFNTPVDVVKLKVPDYHTVIKHPMDLGTIKAKIASSAYSNPWGFAADVRLTFTNAMTYNPPGNDFHFMADVMSKFFEARWRPIEKKLAAADSGVKRKAELPMMVPQPKKRKVPLVNHHIIMQERVKPNIKLEEKESLSRQLRSLIAELPEHIMNFISRHGNNVTCDNEIEIDINSLSDDTLFELRRLLDDYLREKQTRQHAKAVPCGMEIPNESGHLNSSEDPFTGNELADEDVDIGGNDPPISSYPPVEIEKDTAPRSSTISSSGDSSSSDSDSGRCSGSESGDGGACPAKTAKVSGGRETTADQKEGDTMDSHDTNRNVNGLDQREPDACHKPRSVEKDDCKQGGAALSGRPVSPDKLYRAALLRSRFADTILKAHEKTLGQSENQGDPEKLRREREELERRQRKERARLQAEAKAAEEACRRANAAAAAEAKRKRELEREAARQALLKMEKTVDIDENNLVYKDLEMLRAGPSDLVYSSVGETSPDLSPDGFQLRGWNPFEKLGLFTKADEDDEDEVAEPAPADDLEEGEIAGL